jgi:MFS family permease
MPSDPRAAPSGSARALAAVLLGAGFFGYAFLHRVAPGVMVAELMRDFSLGASVLGHLSAFYFYAYAGLQLPVGILMDRFGPRRLLTAAVAFCASGAALMASAGVVETAYLGRLLVGAGAAFSWVGTLTILAQNFPPHRFAFLGGVSQCIGMCGAVFGQAPLRLAVEGAGWRWTLFGLAALGAFLALAIWIVVRDRQVPRPRSGAAFTGLSEAFGRSSNWYCAAFGFSMTGPILAFGGLWGVPYMQTRYGLDGVGAAAAISMLFIGWGVAAPMIGWLSDRFGKRRPLMLFFGILGTVCFALLLLLQGLPFAASLVLLTVAGASGSSMVLAFAYVRANNSPDATGACLGLVNCAVVGAGAVLQPLIGWLLDLNWDGGMDAGARVYSLSAYQAALWALPIQSAIGTAAVLGLGPGMPAPSRR